MGTICVSVLSDHFLCNKRCSKTYNLLKTESEQERREGEKKGRKEKEREGKRRYRV